MSQAVIQAKYDQLAVIAGKFGQQAQATSALRSRLLRSMQPLQAGGWQGQGATAFFAEMNGVVFPAMQRMIHALEEARSVTLQISEIMRQAEEEASAPFRGASDGGSKPDAQAQPKEASNGLLGGVHEVLDWAGFIPGAGAVPDLINAGIYTVEGDWGNAVLSGAAAIPVAGDLVKGIDKARDVARVVDKLDDAADAARAVDKADDAANAVKQAMEEKILYGQRVPNPKSPSGMSNEVIGGHSARIKNHPDYAVEVLSKNPDGTTDVKYTTQFPDGNLAKIKKSTLAPDSWSDQKIIDTTANVANTPAGVSRVKDRVRFHRQTVDGVEWEVIRDASGNVIASYPTGGNPLKL